MWADTHCWSVILSVSSQGSNPEDFSHLPPEQRRKKLQAKIDDFNKDIQKEMDQRYTDMDKHTQTHISFHTLVTNSSGYIDGNKDSLKSQKSSSAYFTKYWYFYCRLYSFSYFIWFLPNDYFLTCFTLFFMDLFIYLLYFFYLFYLFAYICNLYHLHNLLINDFIYLHAYLLFYLLICIHIYIFPSLLYF